jgi:GAF domain-containing protein
MVDHAALQRACVTYARNDLRSFDLDDVLDRLTEQLTETLGVSGSGVWLAESGRLRFITATDGSLVMLEEAQGDIADGPCQEAWRSGEVVAIGDLRDSRRWPAYAAIALAAGQCAVAAIPATAADQRVGLVSLYHEQPHDWSAEVLDAASLLADMAAGYIVNRRTLEHSQQLARRLQQALDSRVLVEQAKGVLAERHGLTMELALDRLHAYARAQDRPVQGRPPPRGGGRGRGGGV